MRLFKSILKLSTIKKLFVLTVAAYIKLAYLTARKIYKIHPLAQPFLAGDKNAIFTFWHGKMMMMPYTAPSSRMMNVLISKHSDGIFISDVMKEFNFETIQGSTNKNGVSALMSILRNLRKGANVAITPDGPRGPFQTASAGAAVAAKLSGKPILPLSFSASWLINFASWDCLTFVLPFSKIVFVAEEPVYIDRNLSDEEATDIVQKTLNKVTEISDAAFL